MKKSDFYHLGGRGGKQGLITFYFLFFFPNVLKIISRNSSFFMYSWSLANIKCVAANITSGATNILGGRANILHSAINFLHGMAGILCSVPDISHVQHQYFQIFLSVLCFSKLRVVLMKAKFVP